jgi:Domain of unknown function (DUF4041)/Meiotically up-regulated gene 113
MSEGRLRFNPPPGWPRPPSNWVPPKGWTPDPSWPAAPLGWQIWIDDSPPVGAETPAVPQVEPVLRESIIPLDQRVAFLESENAALRARLEAAGTDVNEAVLLDDEKILQDVGIYRYHHPLENALAYRERLEDLSARIVNMIKAGGAIEKSDLFTFNGSLAKGRRMTEDLARLMLRAYNAEADNVLRSLRSGNVVVAKKRMEASREAIAKLGKLMEMRIGDQFHQLRIEELELAADYAMKKQEEKEAEREARERLREERKVALELAAERERLEKERSHLVNAIEKLRLTGSTSIELEQRMSEVESAIATNDYRVANVRAGYVYIISNRGAFGSQVVKIGLTRRLEPLDRINELSGASVPFHFDVHALYFSKDAVTLENELHQQFAERRVNWANARKEFFFATPAEVRDVLIKKTGNLLDFVEQPVSTEFVQSIRYWPDSVNRNRLQ